MGSWTLDSVVAYSTSHVSDVLDLLQHFILWSDLIGSDPDLGPFSSAQQARGWVASARRYVRRSVAKRGISFALTKEIKRAPRPTACSLCSLRGSIVRSLLVGGRSACLASCYAYFPTQFNSLDSAVGPAHGTSGQ